MKDRNDFYTYAFLREDGTPYYIGKGCGRRAYRINLPPERVLILKKDLTEIEAWRHEIYMISVFGRKDTGTGILRNRSNGGEKGAIGWKPSAETKLAMGRAKLGKNNPMKRPQVRQKVSQALTGRKNPEHSARMTGRKASEETRRKMSETHKNSLRPRFQCLVTGHISTASGLSNWQKRRGIDYSLRIKINE